MGYLNLFIDESGAANPKVTSSPCYILCGCMVNQNSRDKLKTVADQIKFKYWGRTGIVFHSREIGRRAGDFDILKNREVRKDFIHDMNKLLNKGGYQVLAVIVDRKKAMKMNWNDKTVYKNTAKAMVKNYILTLLAKNIKGRLVVESATSQKDFSFHNAAVHFLSNGLEATNSTYNEVQNLLTEISFVTKKNHDIEEQIADLLAYGAKLKFTNKKYSNMNNYEKMISKTLNRKLFVMHPNTGKRKKEFYEKINSFQIMP